MNVELLAPAGSYETAVAAISAGADAVYMGGTKFGARAYAENGDEDTIIKAIKYAHLHGKSLYLTVNTLLKNKEMEDELYDYLLPYYRVGLDAVIVQDPGVLMFIKEHFPGLPIHASTQMTITGVHSAKLLEEMGCTRIVTARELSLDEISRIHNEIHIEIESFIHGALCYCYSGQCLMSSMIGGRSGNRGRCAQPCRLPYQVFENGRKINTDKNQYALSPKDMCTLEILPQIIEAGVFSLKIEGRMKKPEYTAGVVRIYRKYLDLYRNDPASYQVSQKDMQELFDLYNRDGFHTGYYLDHNGPDMMAVQNKKATEGQKRKNETLFEEIRKNYVDTIKQIPISGRLELYKNKRAKLTVNSLTFEGHIVDAALKQPLDVERVRKQICKTGNTPFTFENIEILMDPDVFMPMQTLNELRRTALDNLEEKIVSAYYRDIEKQKKSIGINSIKKAIAADAFSVSIETKEQLEEVINSSYVKRIYASITLFEKKEQILQYINKGKARNKQCYISLPYVVRHDLSDSVGKDMNEYVELGLDGYLIRNLETLHILKEKNLIHYAVADANLYTYNHMAQKFYATFGILEDTIPYELNKGEISHRDNHNSEMIIYGYQPLMISAQCVKKNFSKCNKKSETMVLQDRYKKNFHVQCVCDHCYNIIYNSIPLGLLKEAELVRSFGVKAFRLNFTNESSKEVNSILQQFYNAYYQRKIQKGVSDNFTKGHLKRGVE